MKGLVLALALTAACAPTASAHSLKGVEDDLYAKEKYFQPLDKEAPDFALMDADGREIGRLVGPSEWDAPEMVSVLRKHIKETRRLGSG